MTNLLERLASLTGARSIRRVERVQSLWSGYGELARYALDGASVIEGAAHASVVVKHVRPPRDARGVSDERKRRSYDNELAFYRDYASRCDHVALEDHGQSRTLATDRSAAPAVDRAGASASARSDRGESNAAVDRSGAPASVRSDRGELNSAVDRSGAPASVRSDRGESSSAVDRSGAPASVRSERGESNAVDRSDRGSVIVARLFAADSFDGEWLFVFEDLALAFPRRLADGTRCAVEPALAWLARLHARFVGDPCAGLWPHGTYWHLATRQDELAVLSAAARSRAIADDAVLAAARFQTLLHGDAKEANFLFTSDLAQAAAVDFQYAGRGCGMKDVAYLLYGHDDAPIDYYFEQLRGALPPTVDAAALEAEWRALYPVAQRDFARFLAGWR